MQINVSSIVPIYNTLKYKEIYDSVRFELFRFGTAQRHSSVALDHNILGSDFVMSGCWPTWNAGVIVGVRFRWRPFWPCPGNSGDGQHGQC